ncbi:acyltransferase family protein [Weissella confusa]|uniref:acyltransferase family protein n=1 Tax=Weissella confusa TaxID=1583 RepID=UPI003BABAC6A
MGPGWYLIATIFSVWLIAILLKKKWKKLLAIVALLVLIGTIGTSSYVNLLELSNNEIRLINYWTPYTSFIAGVPWVFLGYLIRRTKFSSFSFKIKLSVSLVFLLAFIIENYFITHLHLGRRHAFSIMLVLFGGWAFAWLTSVPKRLSINPRRVKYIRNLSSVVYMIHIFAIYLSTKVFTNLAIHNKALMSRLWTVFFRHRKVPLPRKIFKTRISA